MKAAWLRTTSQRPCPICGKGDWCMVSSNGSVAICPRTEEGSTKYLDGSGYLHVIDKSAPIPPKSDEQGKEMPEHNIVLSTLASRMMAAATDEMVSALAKNIGVPTFALRLLRVGWSATSDAFSFPMWRFGKRLIGIRLRSMSGKKWAIKGSKSGLFIPDQWPSMKKGVIVCEGPTDTAALLGLGFNAIGRPSALGSYALVEEAVEGRHVCVVSDSDSVGIDSANKLANHLQRSGSCLSVRIIVPPAKDARKWINEGATRACVQELISRAPAGLSNSRLISSP